MTNSVQLREVTDADLPIFFEHQRDPDANQMAAFPPRDPEAFTAHWARIMGNAAIVLRTIVCDGQVAGNIVCFEESGKQEVGYWLGKEYWGQGIATQALSAFLELIHQRPLYAFVAGHNPGSRRVLEKCGFALCGEEEEGFLLKLDADEQGEML